MANSHLDKVLSSYQHIGNLVYDAASNTSAADAHGLLRWFLLDMPVVPALLAFHSLFAALSVYKLTKGKQFWFKVSFECSPFSSLSAQFPMHSNSCLHE